MQIPTINPATISDNELSDLMRIGFCYVRMPDEHLRNHIRICLQAARQFFINDAQHKSKWQLKESFAPGERYQGYTLRSQSRNTNAVEQIFFEPQHPFGPFEPHSALIHAIHSIYMQQIFTPLVKSMFAYLSLPPDYFHIIGGDPYCSLVFQTCPALSDEKTSVRLNAHKDFGLMTILYFEEPGLEVKCGDTWIAIPPQEDCLVVNLGNALELMTGKQCHSAVHRVINATENRTSMVYFINPNYQQPVRNLFDHSLIAANGEAFFKQQFTEFYQLEY